jgi:phage recombination protein Bet
MNTAVATTQSRLPAPPGIEPGYWRVLTEAIYPNAKSAQSIMLALDYCRARKLDPIKKPVNIVSVWDSRQRKYVEQIWPSINETEITAARTSEWGGVDAPVFGPDKTQQFKGRVKEDQGWKDVTVNVTFPEWCERTVYRVIKGIRCPFTERIYWAEEYSHAGGGELPNHMWAKRPKGQFAKVAKAAALRTAFPEEEGAEPTDEEMVGVVETDRAPLQPIAEPAPAAAPAAEPAHDTETGEVIDDDLVGLTKADAESWEQWGQRFLAAVRASPHIDDLELLVDENGATLNQAREELPEFHKKTMQRVQARKLELLPDGDPA